MRQEVSPSALNTDTNVESPTRGEANVQSRGFEIRSVFAFSNAYSVASAEPRLCPVISIVADFGV